jgi:hypothetical protein
MTLWQVYKSAGWTFRAFQRTFRTHGLGNWLRYWATYGDYRATGPPEELHQRLVLTHPDGPGLLLPRCVGI